MALINCTECNKEISDKSTVCIHCGNPINIKPTQFNQLYNDKYSKVGGWLLFFVICHIFTLTNVFFNAKQFIDLKDISNSRYLVSSLKTSVSIALVSSGIGLLVALVGSTFLFISIIQIIAKKKRFLFFMQISFFFTVAWNVLVQIIPNLILGEYVGTSSVREFMYGTYYVLPLTLSVFVSSIAGIFIITLYYCKSVRVRTYMRNDDYIKTAIFSFNKRTD